MFAFAFGIGAYVIFALTFLYAIGFVENWVVAFTIDGPPGASVGHPAGWVLNVFLLALFAAQHSLMARPEFKRVWARTIPPVLERSAYVLVSSLMLMFVFLRWTPIPFVLWDVGVNLFGFLLEMLSYAGWALVLASTFQIDHLELFGLKQVLCHVRCEDPPRTEFQVPFLYRFVRHPTYLGFLVAFWCTPRMTVGRLLFAALATAYILVAVRFEERDLEHEHFEYRAYRQRVPRLLPFRRPG